MSSLRDILLSKEKRPAVAADCTSALEQYISGRGGLKGMAIKAALAMGKAARPDMLLRGVGQLLPDIVTALEASYQESLAGGRSFEAVVESHSAEISKSLVALADRRMATVQNPTAKTIFKKLRGDGEAEMQALLKPVTQALARHL